MKRTTLFYAALAVLFGVTLVFGQGLIISGGRRWSRIQEYDPKTRPPLSLPEAYTLALDNLAADTNRFHCVTASCVESTNKGFTGWMFRFADTNGQRLPVMVFFDGWVHRVDATNFTK
jgi:hypothetical protein